MLKRIFKIIKREGFCSLSKKICRRFFGLLFIPYTAIRIKNFNSENLEDLVKFVFAKDPIKPSQVPEEISRLLEILKEKQPKTILEIGTAKGGTLFLFSRIAPKEAEITSVDLPKDNFGGGYSMWRTLLYKSFALNKQKINLLRMDSHKEETFKKVKDILGSRLIDFLFIDGDHSYDGVKKDFELYRALVKSGGIISFHDIVPGPEEDVGGVPQFWQEIKNSYRHEEVVKNWNQGGYGIGVIFN